MIVSSCLVMLLAGSPEPVETKFAQLAPVLRERAPFARTAGKHRAVVLLHGLHVYGLQEFSY